MSYNRNYYNILRNLLTRLYLFSQVSYRPVHRTRPPMREFYALEPARTRLEPAHSVLVGVAEGVVPRGCASSA